MVNVIRVDGDAPTASISTVSGSALSKLIAKTSVVDELPVALLIVNPFDVPVDVFK